MKEPPMKSFGPQCCDWSMSFTCLQNSFSKFCLFTFCTTYSHSNIQEYVFIVHLFICSCDFRELGSWIPGTFHSNTTVAHNCPITCNSKEIQMHVVKPKSPHAGSNVHGRKNYSWCICYSSVFYPLSERISKHAFPDLFMTYHKIDTLYNARKSW